MFFNYLGEIILEIDFVKKGLWYVILFFNII